MAEMKSKDPGDSSTNQQEHGQNQDDLQRAWSNSLASADLETAITKSGFGKFNVALSLLSIPASFTNGFDTGSMSYVIPAAAMELGLTPSQKAMLQSASYAGMISAGFFWGFLSDTFGRKKLMVLGYCLNCLLNILTGAFPILPLMLIFKYLSGFMICGPFSIFPTYISEVFPKKQRTMAVLSIGMFASLGQVAMAGLALLVIPAEVPSQIPFKSWQLFQMACSIPSFISALGCLFFVESPKFLADKGDTEGALKIYQTIYTINSGNHSNTYPIKQLKQHSEKNKSRLAGFLEGMDIFRSPFIQKASIVFIIQVGTAVTQNTIRLWLPEMLTLVKSSELDNELGLCPLLQEGNMASTSNSNSKTTDGEQVYVEMMIVSLIVTISHMTLLLVVGWIGTKKLLLCCSLLSAFCSAAITFVRVNYVFIPASAIISATNVVIFCDINIMVHVFPTRIRATSVSVLMIIARAGIFGFNFLVANLIYTYCLYFFYGLTLLLLVLATLSIFVPEEPIDEAPSKALS